MKILVDADACPTVGLLVNIAKQYPCEIILVSDYLHNFEEYEVKHVRVMKGKDSADEKILSLLQKGDIVVSNDGGLAVLALIKGAKVINFNGVFYQEQSIDGLLWARHWNARKRRSGERLKGQKKRSKQQDEQFAEAVLKLLSTIGE